MKLFEFKPKLVSCLKNYSKETFMADLMAGVIVGIVALPLAIAFGIASGVSPEKGIITAIIAGFIISLLGGSKVQIGGPTGAFIVIIYGIIQQYGEAGLIVATLMAGVLLILLGVFKLGAVIKFIPYPIIVGFTSGIAVTIFTTQIADIFGLSFGGEKVPGTGGVTSKMETRFRKSISTNDTHVVLRASLREQKRNIAIIEARLYNSMGELCTEATCTYFTFPKEKAEAEMHFHSCEVEQEEILPLI